MEPSKIVVNARTVREAQDSTVVRMYERGEPITRIMAVTGKSYARVRNTLELAGLV